MSGSKSPSAHSGIMDLSDWDFGKQPVLNLDGEWEFYWQNLLGPANFKAGRAVPKASYLDLPGLWNGYDYNGNALSGEGFSTFRLNVKVPKQNRLYGIRVSEMDTAYALWINGKLLAECGKVGKSREEMTPSWQRKEIFFTAPKGKIEIIMQMSNFYHRKGGPEESIKFGTAAGIFRFKNIMLGIELFMIGSILIMALYHFCLYLRRRKEITTLFFWILCFAMIFRIILTGEKLVYEIFSGIGWGLATKIEYIDLSLIIPFAALFYFNLFRDYMHKWFIRIIIYVSIFFIILILVTPARIYTYLVVPIETVLIVPGIYIIICIAMAALNREKGAVIVLFGLVCFFITGVNDTLYNNLIINTGYIWPFGLFMVIFSQSLILSIHYTRALDTAEVLSNNLEVIVDERTKELDKERKKLEIISQEDELTRVFNRRFTLKVLEKEIEKFKRYNSIFSVMVLDIDHFKRVNDTYGHLAGDEVLKTIAGIIQKNIRSTDTCGRYGGEEFIIIMPATGMVNAYSTAEKIRNRISNFDFTIEGDIVSITCSIGIAEIDGSANTVQSLLEKADKAMYRAKEAGRNKVISG